MPSKYDALRDYLRGQRAPTVTLKFRELEKILGFALPPAARRHAAWWANGGHPYSKAWTSSGRKARPRLTAEIVEFSTAPPGMVSKSHRVPLDVKVAAEVWIATALLHRERPRVLDFSIDEIVARAAKENITGHLRPGVYQHVVSHAVANRPPSPNRYCYLLEPASRRRRLCRPGDPIDPRRLRTKMQPESDELPARYRPLLEWYRKEYAVGASAGEDPLMALIGLGKEIWKDVDADEYVRQLREDWD